MEDVGRSVEEEAEGKRKVVRPVVVSVVVGRFCGRRKEGLVLDEEEMLESKDDVLDEEVRNGFGGFSRDFCVKRVGVGRLDGVGEARVEV